MTTARTDGVRELTKKPESEMTENEHRAVVAAHFFMAELMVNERGAIVPAADDKDGVRAVDYLASIMCDLLDDKSTSATVTKLRDVLRQISEMKREDLYLADSELPIDNAAAWTAKNALAETSQ